ncbi:MAG: peptidylprolyl isomerase [Actinobacteria bacterium]|nr:peptidylprolyl isomerase [Actinomycetota bacterium]
MSPSNARRRQLQKLAQRRAEERRRARRKRILATVVALAVAAGGGTLVFLAFTGSDEKKPSASPSAGPSVTPAGEVACGGTRPAAADVEKQTYAKAPKMAVVANKTYTAVMKTSCGTIKLDLDAKNAPNTVNSLVFLAREGFFDGLVFHRTVKDFVIQGGDPTGTGSGGPGYQTVDTPPNGTTYKAGDLAMAKTQAEAPGTAGSQFFVVTGNPAALNQSPVYALVGRVTAGLDVAKAIEQLPTADGATDGAPAQTVYIESVKIVVS